MVAKRRILTDTFLVTSSNRPKINAGIPAKRIALRIARFSAAAIPWLDAANPAKTPMAMAMPPMRGVGLVWTFCTPVLESMEKAPCHFFVHTNNRQVTNDARRAITASYRRISVIEKLEGGMYWSFRADFSNNVDEVCVFDVSG